MIRSLTLHQLAQILAVELPDRANLAAALDQPLTQISTDSRSIQPGSLFVALQGERFDGHAFLDQVQQQGAIAALVNQQAMRQIAQTDLPDLLLLPVADTLQAYQQMGQWWRKQLTLPVIAVTGSVGKTTTKELIAALLATQGKVLKTQANYNNEIGVPKTLLELRPEHDFAVIEMGMRASGEIALLSQLASPDIAVITNVGTAHIGRLGSEQAIAEAKCELLQTLPPTSAAVLNADSPLLMQRAAQVWPGKRLTYGLNAGELRGELLDAETIRVRGVELKLPLPGRHHASNYLAAIAVAELLQIDWSALPPLSLELPQGRARRDWLPNDILLLDETYNAGLESMLAALQLLADIPATRRIAVLGTMKELGEQSQALHYRVGAMVQQLKLDALLILADPAEAAAMAEGAMPLVAEQFASQAELINRLRTLMAPGDRLLFKASRAVGLDQVIQPLRELYLPSAVSS